jgi:hypothetical protein
MKAGPLIRSARSDSYTCLQAATDCYNEIFTVLAVSAVSRSADH